MPFTIPPPNKVQGQSGFMPDIDNAYAALAAIAQVNVLNSAYAGGADPTGASDSTTAFTQAYAALAATGGVIRVPAGTYRLNSTFTAALANNATVTIQGDGQQATILNFYGTGDAIRMRNPNTFVTGMNISWRSGLRGLTIDGTNAGAGSTGLHLGDIGLLKMDDVAVQNFTGAGSIGIRLDNSVTWTEEADVRAEVANCTQHVVFEVTTGYKSFGYGSFDFTIFAGSNQQDAVVLKNGPWIYHGSLRIRGNHTAGVAATTAAVLRMSGVAPVGTPNAGALCEIISSRLEMQVECGGSGNAPQAVVLDSVNFATLNAWGIIDLAVGGVNFAASTVANGQFVFGGIVNDPTGTLAKWASGETGALWRTTGQPVPGSAMVTRVSGTTLNLWTNSGDMASYVLPASTTISLNDATANGGATLGVPQRITIVIQQAAAGGFTVTWPHAASPTTSAAKVTWAGGAAPVMTAAASAVDAYMLETIDGATWYGRAIQNVS